MSTVSTERPGVYSSYTVVSSYANGAGIKAAGVVAASPTGEKLVLKHFTKLNEAFAEYGSNTDSSMMAAVVKILFLNHVNNLYCISVGENATAEEYTAAFAQLNEVQEVCGVVCDSADLAVQQQLAQILTAVSLSSHERIGFFGIPCSAEPAEAARVINCERLCLCAPAVKFEGGAAQSGAYLAAACCAAALSKSDPAANLNLTEVAGDFLFPARYTEEELTALLKAGVSVFEKTAGKAELIRALTTKTSENGVPDSSFHELSTVLILDDVIPAIRALLKAQLRGAKNNAATRDAMRTQVACELSKKCSAGIIDSFEAPVVYPKEDEPTVCIVEISFAVVYGIHRIDLVAHISV